MSLHAFPFLRLHNTVCDLLLGCYHRLRLGLLHVLWLCLGLLLWVLLGRYRTLRLSWVLLRRVRLGTTLSRLGTRLLARLLLWLTGLLGRLGLLLLLRLRLRLSLLLLSLSLGLSLLLLLLLGLCLSLLLGLHSCL